MLSAVIYQTRRNSNFVLFFLFFLFSLKSLSHPLDIGLLEIKSEDSNIELQLELNPELVKEILKSTELSPEASKEQILNTAIGSNAQKLFQLTVGQNQIQTNDQNCSWNSDAFASLQSESNVVLKVSAHCADINKSLHLELPFIKKISESFQLIVKIKHNENEILTEANSQSPFINASFNETQINMSHFILKGVGHIGAMPNEWKDSSGWHFPKGIDHIIFVIALVLSSLKLIDILKTVTGFTIGHSITLAFGSLGLISIPSPIVEAAIALSIAIAATERFWPEKYKSGWILAIVFGLIHGLGFASAIQELNLNSSHLISTLLAFNVGVEIGQIIIVLISFPVLFMVSKTVLGRKLALPAFCISICVLGIYWFIERASFISF